VARFLIIWTLLSCLQSSHKVLFAGNIPLDGLYPGFVLTLNGYQLTGQIGDIMEMNGNHTVIFMNDFGSIYSGFYLKTETNSFFYESKYDGKHWLYLQLLFREKGVSLYQLPVDRIQWIYDKGMSKPFSYPVIEYFLDVSSLGNPIKLTRATYRKKLMLLFKKRNLDLASKIGKPGYRFQNLPEIIRQFTQSLLDKEKILL
jgi:hypothetical protein